MINVSVKEKDGLYSKVYTDEIRKYNPLSGKKKKAITDKYSLAAQLNIMRKAILSGDMTELQEMDDYINSI